jgi:hypothetical protein
MWRILCDKARIVCWTHRGLDASKRSIKNGREQGPFVIETNLEFVMHAQLNEVKHFCENLWHTHYAWPSYTIVQVNYCTGELLYR